MKEQPLKNLDPRNSRIFYATRWSALLAFSALLGCDKMVLVGAMVDDPDAGGQGPASGTGGAANPSTLGAGGTASATTDVNAKVPPPGGGEAGGAGGAGGITATTIIPSGVTVGSSCAPISTVPGILNPCAQSFGVAYSPDGQILAVGSNPDLPSVHLWRLSDGMPLPNLNMQTADTTYNLVFSPDGKTLATAGYIQLPGGQLPRRQLVRIGQAVGCLDGRAHSELPRGYRFLCGHGGLYP